MSHAHRSDVVPRPLLTMAGALVAFSLLLAVSVRLGLAPPAAVPSIERAKGDVGLVEQRLLTFHDQADGSVLVGEAENGTTLKIIAGEKEGGGFIRGVLRGMARERRMRGIDSRPPFELSLWQDGSLSLADPATGRTVEIGAFGPDNRAAFAQFLEAGLRS